MKLLRLAIVTIGWCGLLAGCGGGASTAAPAALVTPVSIEATSTGDSSAGSINADEFSTFMNSTAMASYARFGDVVGYWNQKFNSVLITSTPTSTDSTNNTTTLKIFHQGHGARNGDAVSISGVIDPVHGLSPTVINGQHTILWKNLDEYFIQVSGSANPGTASTFTATLNYKYHECSGYQTLIQYPPAASDTNLVFGVTQATRTTSVVTSVLNNCSPNTSRYTTFKYYNAASCASCNFFLGQSIVNGVYAVVETSFKMPQGALNVGDSGEYGAMVLYKDSTRTSKEGRTVLSYEVQSSAAGALMVLIGKTYTMANILVSDARDYFARTASGPNWQYSLIGTTVKYNTQRQTEVSVQYRASPVGVVPPNHAGSGTVTGEFGVPHSFKFIPINVADLPLGGEIMVKIKTGTGSSGVVYYLLDTSTPEYAADSTTPIHPLVSYSDIPPPPSGQAATMSYKFPAGSQRMYFLAIAGSASSAPTESNTYDYEIWAY